MKKFKFTVKDLKEAIKDFDDDLEIFVSNSCNITGDVSELCEVKEDSYQFFGQSIPCLVLDTAENVTFDEEDD